MDDAVVHLTDIVNNISRRYPESDRDDIQQACWLRIFEALEKGKHDTALLIRSAGFAARDELKTLQSGGLTPGDSKYPAPQRVQPSWGDDHAEDDGWLEPSYEATPSSDDLYDHLYASAANDDERAVVAAGRRLLAQHDDDLDIRLGSVASLARESGLPTRRAKAARSSLQSGLN